MTKLSETELVLMQDKNFFIHKQNITSKIISLFGELHEDLKLLPGENTSHIPSGILSISGKISKGENYIGYPWILLDYPRAFSKKNILAYRTLFWWGNYFSFTLHLSGDYLRPFLPSIIKNLSSLANRKIYICINTNQWVHHLEKDNFISIESFLKENQNPGEIFSRNGFIKLSGKLEINEWEKLKKSGYESYLLYLELLKP